MAFAHVLSSSDDEDFVDIINRRLNNVRRRPAYFNEFDDVDFHARFRLSKECTTEVLEAIEPEILHPTER
jgi:hypothetical protein